MLLCYIVTNINSKLTLILYLKFFKFPLLKYWVYDNMTNSLIFLY